MLKIFFYVYNKKWEEDYVFCFAWDIYLTGNPQITLGLSTVHTNLSMESIEQTFNGTVHKPTFNCYCIKNGGLVHKCIETF